MTNSTEDERRRLKDVGGTSGGLGEFVMGAILLALGGYWMMSRVVVTSGYGSLFGRGSFGMTLLPIFIGVTILFWNGRSIIGWLMAGGGVVAIFVGIISDLHLYFLPTTLLHTLLMLIAIAGGLGLIFRAIMPHD